MPQPVAVSDPLRRALIGRRRKRRFAKPDHRRSPMARAGTELEQVADSVLAAERADEQDVDHEPKGVTGA